MKIVSWNAACKFREKFDAVQALGAELYVIQECEDPQSCTSLAYREFANNGYWWGTNSNKGLGVFAAPHVRLSENAWPADSLRWFGSVRVNDSWDLVAVWSNPNKKNKSIRDYIHEINAYVELHAARHTADSVILGDFNSNQQWADLCGAEAHSSLVTRMEAIGLCSAYHHCSGEVQGAERVPTFIHRSNGMPYHIDHAFAAPSRVRSCVIDSSRDWGNLSDHLPLVLELI